MLSKWDPEHSEAEMMGVQPVLFNDDRSKDPAKHSDQTNTACRSQSQHPEARFAWRKSSPNTARKKICQQDINERKAEDYWCIDDEVSISAVMTNCSDVNAVSLRETGEQHLHAFLTSLVPLRAMSKTFIRPAYRHILRGCSVEPKVTSIDVRCKVQRATIRFDPLTVRADGIIA